MKHWLWRPSGPSCKGRALLNTLFAQSKHGKTGREERHLQIPELLSSHDILEDAVRMNNVVMSSHVKGFSCVSRSLPVHLNSVHKANPRLVQRTMNASLNN
jgi:hypothetical protein